MKTVKIPARSPNLSAYAERFVLSVKSECLAKIIPLGERHLRKAVKEYTEHYHLERNHQGLDNELIEKTSRPINEGSAVECRERLGGILKHYYRRAAWTVGRFMAQHAEGEALFDELIATAYSGAPAATQDANTRLT